MADFQRLDASLTIVTTSVVLLCCPCTLRLLEEGYGPASLQLEIIKTHIGSSLLENAAVVRWLAKTQPEYLQQLQRIADIKELPTQ